MKTIQIITALISFITWYSTDVYTLDGWAHRRPAATAEKPAQQQAQSKIEPATIDDAKRTELESQFAHDWPYLTGEYEVLAPNGDTYKYFMQMELVNIPKGSLDGDGLYANVLINFDQEEALTSYARAQVKILGPKRFSIRLQTRPVEKYVGGRDSYRSIDYVPENLEVSSVDGTTWDLMMPPNENGYSPFKMKGHLMKTPTQTLSKFAGKWKGNIGEYPTTFDFSPKGNFLTGVYRIAMVYPCKYANVHVRLTGENRVSIIGGDMDKTETYTGCEAPLIRAQILPDGTMKTITYWYSGDKVESTFTKQ